MTNTPEPQTLYVVAVVVGDADVPFTQKFDSWMDAAAFAGHMRLTYTLPVKVEAEQQ